MFRKRSRKSDDIQPKEKHNEELSKKERERWAIAVSVITALTGLLIAAARLLEALLASSSC